MLRRVANNAVLNGIALAVRMSVSVVLTPFLIHHLGVGLYGVWVLILAFSVTGYLSLLSLGLPAALVKAIAEHHARGEDEPLRGVFTAGAAVFSLLGVAAASILWLFGQFAFVRIFHVPPQYAATAVALVSLIALQALVDFPGLALSAVLEGLQRYDWLSLIDLGRSLCFSAGAVLLLRAGHGAVSLAWLLVSLSAASVLMCGLLARRLLPALRLTRHIERAEVTSMARMSATMFLLRVNAVIYGQMDKAILAVVLSTEVLAHYDVAARFHSLVLVSMGLVSSVVLSTSAALNARGDHDGLKRLFLLGTRYSVAVSVPLAVMLMVLARPLLRIWLGPAFVGDAGLVWLFLAYTLFWGLKEVGWNLMIGTGRATAILKIQLWTTALNVLVSVVATYRFGVAGVLIGTLSGNTIAMVLYLRLYLPALRLSLGEFVRATVLPVYPQVIMAGTALALATALRAPASLREVMVYSAGFGALFLTLFVTTGIPREDRALMAAAWRSRRSAKAAS